MNAKEFIDKKKETMFLSTINLEGDLMVSDNQLITLMENYHQAKLKNHGDIGDIGDVVRNLCCENPDININNYLYMDKNDLTKKVGSKRNCMNCGKSEYSQ